MKVVPRTVVVLLALTLAAWAVPATFTGTLTDTMCTKKHMMPGKSDADCVRECVKSGGKYALASGKAVYELKGDTKALDALAGQQVVVTGSREGSTITIEQITAKH